MNGYRAVHYYVSKEMSLHDFMFLFFAVSDGRRFVECRDVDAMTP